jgi:hypothetical protein
MRRVTGPPGFPGTWWSLRAALAADGSEGFAGFFEGNSLDTFDALAGRLPDGWSFGASDEKSPILLSFTRLSDGPDGSNPTQFPGVRERLGRPVGLTAGYRRPG